MKYNKPPLTLQKQTRLLLSRGFQANENDLVTFLQFNNYYRFTGYLYPFRDENDHYTENITLKKIKIIYEYDQKLRNHVLSAVDKIEIALRTSISCFYSNEYGPFSYLDYSTLSELPKDRYDQLIRNIEKETYRSKEVFIKHFKQKYGDKHNHLPLWMVVEILSLGSLVSFYKGLSNNLKQSIAKEYKIPDEVLTSWIIGLNSIRNTCAHHSRLYNRRLGYRFKFPRIRKYPEWYNPVKIPNNSVFSVLSICNYLLNIIDSDNKWAFDTKQLFDEYKHVKEIKNTYPTNWYTSKIWTKEYNNE